MNISNKRLAEESSSSFINSTNRSGLDVSLNSKRNGARANTLGTPTYALMSKESPM